MWAISSDSGLVVHIIITFLFDVEMCRHKALLRNVYLILSRSLKFLLVRSLQKAEIAYAAIGKILIF